MVVLEVIVATLVIAPVVFISFFVVVVVVVGGGCGFVGLVVLVAVLVLLIRTQLFSGRIQRPLYSGGCRSRCRVVFDLPLKLSRGDQLIYPPGYNISFEIITLKLKVDTKH